jgi:hypothetical protein
MSVGNMTKFALILRSGGEVRIEGKETEVAMAQEKTIANNEWTSKTSQAVQSTMDADDEDGKWKTEIRRGGFEVADDVESWTVAGRGWLSLGGN